MDQDHHGGWRFRHSGENRVILGQTKETQPRKTFSVQRLWFTWEVAKRNGVNLCVWKSIFPSVRQQARSYGALQKKSVGYCQPKQQSVFHNCFYAYMYQHGLILCNPSALMILFFSWQLLCCVRKHVLPWGMSGNAACLTSAASCGDSVETLELCGESKLFRIRYMLTSAQHCAWLSSAVTVLCNSHLQQLAGVVAQQM